jgi:hypothetical protein
MHVTCCWCSNTLLQVARHDKAGHSTHKTVHSNQPCCQCPSSQFLPIRLRALSKCRFRVADHIMTRYLASLDAVLSHGHLCAPMDTWASKDLDEENTHKATSHGATGHDTVCSPTAPKEKPGLAAGEGSTKRQQSVAAAGLQGAAQPAQEEEEEEGVTRVDNFGPVGKAVWVAEDEKMMQQVESLIGEAPFMRFLCSR